MRLYVHITVTIAASYVMDPTKQCHFSVQIPHHAILDCPSTVVVRSPCWIVVQRHIRVGKPVNTGHGEIVGAQVRHDRAVRVRSLAVSISMGVVGLHHGVVPIMVAPTRGRRI